MGRRIQIDIDCADPTALARWWATVLEYELAPPPDGHTSWEEFSAAEASVEGEGWARLVDPEGVGSPVLFHRVPEEKVAKNRLHLDVFVTKAHERGTPAHREVVDAEVERLTKAGATHVRTEDDEYDYYIVLQDPEGNEFCVC